MAKSVAIRRVADPAAILGAIWCKASLPKGCSQTLDIAQRALAASRRFAASSRINCASLAQRPLGARWRLALAMRCARARLFWDFIR
jgi:hypothetical protein